MQTPATYQLRNCGMTLTVRKKMNVRVVKDMPQSGNDLTEVEKRNLQAVNAVLQFWNTHDIPAIMNFYDEDIVWRNVAMEETYRGKREVAEFLSKLFTALPDLESKVSHKIAAGDNVSAQRTFSGTHLGPFWGVPPTGRYVEISAMSMVELRDGKFLRDEFYFDTGAILRQMGLMPSLAAAQSAAGRSVFWLLVHKIRVGFGLTGLGLAAILARRRRDARRNTPRLYSDS
jgi:steroid delta-isomerase-like uncharacterized protein